MQDKAIQKMAVQDNAVQMQYKKIKYNTIATPLTPTHQHRMAGRSTKRCTSSKTMSGCTLPIAARYTSGGMMSGGMMSGGIRARFMHAIIMHVQNNNHNTMFMFRAFYSRIIARNKLTSE